MTVFDFSLMGSLDTFSGDDYAAFIAHSQPYTTEATTLPSIESLDTMLPYTGAIPTAPDMSYFAIARPAGSPSVSPADTSGGLPRLSSASESVASAQSATSSTMTSPHMRPQLSVAPWGAALSAIMEPADGGAALAAPNAYFPTSEQDSKVTGYVDPQELNPLHSPVGFAYPDVQLPSSGPYFHQSAPVPSQTAAPGKVKSSSRRVSYNTQSFATYPYQTGRRQSTSSASQNSSHRSSFDEDENTREVCPIPDCGRSFKDLRAHMLTHQTERPEKCPIQTCDYHVKGFARKYDKNRHTLTHYKGTMVCGFCPGSGSGGEKTFNRADVFKRHLTSVHGVEQVAPNSRRKSPMLRGRTATLSVAATGPATGLGSRGLAGGVAPPTGRCSTCGSVFASAQDFYEHLDDCVLRVVQQIDPSEAINEMHLAAVATDSDVRATLERHNLPVDDAATTTVDEDAAVKEEDEADEDAEEDDDDDDEDDKLAVDTMSRNPRSGKGVIQPSSSSSSSSSGPARGGGGGGSNWHSSNRVRKAGRPGLTFSKGGVRSYHQSFAAAAAGSGSKGGESSSAAANSTSIASMSARKRRRHLYPAGWGSTAADGARMKKRVLVVYDGRRRLCKDDMMLDSEFEVRVPLASPSAASASAPPDLGGRYDGGENDDDEGEAGAAPAANAAAAATAYVTDLDVQTLRRANAIFSATEEERGPWIPDNILEMDLNDDILG